MRRPPGIGLATGTALLVALAALALALAPAVAQAQSPWWRLDSNFASTGLAGDQEGQVIVTARNLGDAEVLASAKHPVRFIDVLPAGVKALAVKGLASRGVPGSELSAHPLDKCEIEPLQAGRTEVSCKFEKTLPQYELLSMRIVVDLEGAVPGQAENEVRAEGGQTPSGEEAPPATFTKQLDIHSGETAFGVETYALTPESEGGGVDLQAGSHPFQLTATLDLNETLANYSTGKEEGSYPSAPALPDDLHFKLPPGLIGDPDAVPRCSEAEFDAVSTFEAIDLCPADTAVGVASVVVNDPTPLGFDLFTVPVFNLEPQEGEPARMGFDIQGVPVVMKTAVVAGGNYAVEVTVEDASQAVQLLSSEVTLWGTPADPSHDGARGWECLGDGTWVEKLEVPHPCPGAMPQPATAFLTLPTSCGGEPLSTMNGNSWPAGAGRPGATTEAQPVRFRFSGCSLLSFAPVLRIEPEEHAASTPSGLNATVEMPQPGLLSEEGQAESAVRETTVTLPEGLLLSPSAANGLEACASEQAGFIEEAGGLEAQLSEQRFTPTLPPPEKLEPGVNICADSTKVGTVSISTPLLENELHGAVYLGSQDTAPFRSPLVLYLLAQDPVSGIAVKLAGEVRISETGQLTTTFRNTPQLPFRRLTLHFFGGQRASLSTPPHCGTQTTNSSFAGWSGAGAAPSSSFTVESGAGGSPCAGGALPFAPSMRAGSTTSQAGAFTDFQLEIAHRDGDQQLTGVGVTLPQGMAAILKSVPLCPEPQASLGQCGPESQIGTATASAGLGSEPLTKTGRVYLTGPYDGAPFGLSIVTPAEAGPFDLGEVLVRSAINVDPHTAAVTVTSSLPTYVQGVGRPPSGVPLQLKRVQVTIDRPGFQFNPTNCTPTDVTGTLSGGEGAGAPVSSPFTATGCAALPFAPTLTASTQGAASRANGASLTVRVTATPGQANIAKTVLTLPKALPSRQSTIRQACPEAVFDANPSACDEGSVIGSAIVHTPIFANPLQGPGYLVSHGGAEFPDVEFVLQGENIKLILDGQTKITKGITTSSFNSVPDAPIESFEAVLPEGPHSALGAYLADGSYDLCGAGLQMPTTITGQNGAVIARTTTIAIDGCKGVLGFKKKKLTRTQKLANALAACRRRYPHSHSRRAGCEAKARKTYVAKPARRSNGKH